MVEIGPGVCFRPGVPTGFHVRNTAVNTGPMEISRSLAWQMLDSS